MKCTYLIGSDRVPERFSVVSGEKLELVLLVLPGTSCSLPLEVNLEGEGAEAEIFGLYLCGGDENISFDVRVNHLSGGCVSHQLFKGVVGGEARTSFHGLIYVKRDAQKTKAFQQNNNLLLSKGAKASTEPQLEIYADDVECSHGATVGFLDEDELFYMRSRGIPEAQARRFQILSFISPVSSQIDDEALRAEVMDSLSSLSL